MTNFPCLPWPNALVRGVSHEVWIRTASDTDVERLGDYFGALSCPARYNRFMGAAASFTRMARECLMPARPSDGFVLIAESREADGDAIVGEASYGFDRAGGSGEFAISVADQFRRKGLGFALLSALQSRAISLGHLDLFGETLKGNDEMQSLARKAGFAAGRAADWRAVRFDKRLSP
jgi:GNAT superfamily N-acetyltransferase